MYYLMKLLCRFVSLFSARTLTRFADALSFLLFDVIRLRRQTIVGNVEIAFGDSKSQAEKLAIARSSIRSFILTLLEMLAARRYPLTAQIEVQGDEHLWAALAQGKGVYLLCFHMSNFEAMAAKITQSYAPSCAVMKRVGSRGMTRFVEEYRRDYGLRWIKRENKGDGFRGIQEALARNEIYGFIFDQSRPGEPRLPFFSKPAKTNTSLAAIWRRTRSPIVPCYIYRKEFAQHVMVVKPELEIQCSENAEADILAHSSYFNQVVEACIREKPEQYFWLHNRWK